MKTCLVTTLGFVAGLAATGVAAASADSVDIELAQNTGAVDRSLGNGSMGIGEGIRRLPEQPGADRVESKERQKKIYDEAGHGDNDTDMEHRPRRTLGDRDRDDD